MPTVDRGELAAEFIHHWRCGAVAGNWDASADCFTPDVQNRRDHPGGEGTIEFPGVTIPRHAGGGRFAYEEDFRAMPQAPRATEGSAVAVQARPRASRR